MDDVRVGRVIRALRRRRGWRQADLAKFGGVSQSVVSRAERGHSSLLSVAVVRRLLNALDARAEWSVSWRGGELDRLLDEQHAALGTATVAMLSKLGWRRVLPELTFARFGERGSIDLVAFDEERLAALIIELKSELTSFEETQRRLDVKVRLAPTIIEERVGWRPRHLAVALVLTESRTNRDRVERIASLLKAALPANSIQLRHWRREPNGRLAGVWFVRVMRPRTDNRGSGGAHRVRRPRTA
ncbi:MAG: helix-turn-helix transcriptional regulator [Chloroflexota bacterium]